MTGKNKIRGFKSMLAEMASKESSCELHPMNPCSSHWPELGHTAIPDCWESGKLF